MILNYFVYPLLGAIGVGQWIYEANRHPDQREAAWILGLCVFLCLLPLLFRLNLRRCYRLTRVSDKPCIIELDEENIRTELPGHSRTTLEWAAVQEYREGKKMILIYLAPSRFLAIPKHVLQPHQCEELLTLVRRKVASS